ncbi:MAG: hypothetical protein JWR08_1091 [Enterovirga sp.]|jgi:hypothetical protein|nr:hypothetical protein [Enterovirga sp.]
MSSDTPEIRTELNAAWRAVSDRLIGVGYSRAAVVETMMSMALSDLDELYGLQEATHYILKARSLRRKGAEAEGRDEARPIPPAAVTG